LSGLGAGKQFIYNDTVPGLRKTPIEERTFSRGEKMITLSKPGAALFNQSRTKRSKFA
jgi:hypothetical protein